MRWDYQSLRFSFKGRGITQELISLERNGEPLDVWTNEHGRVAKTLPELLEVMDEDGWERATHAAAFTNGSHLHYMIFKRSKVDRAAPR